MRRCTEAIACGLVEVIVALFYNKIGSIIPMVVLPTTEIIEPFILSYTHRNSNSNHVSFTLPYSSTGCG